MARPSQSHRHNFRSQASAASSVVSFASLATEEDPTPNGGHLAPYRIAGLTCIIAGIQVFWSILMAHGSPYLRSLGFSESLTSVVLIGGPLSSAFLSPTLGAWSDNLSPQGRYGRRAPFIVLGAMGVAVFLCVLANIREILQLFLGVSRNDTSLVVPSSIFCVYLLDIAITALQIGSRSLIVDCLAPEQQKDASAWVSRWSCIAAVAAFWLSSVDIATALPFLGPTHFSALSYLEVILLAVVVPWTLWCSGNRDKEVSSTQAASSPFSGIWRRQYRAFVRLPDVIWHVFVVQLWAWNAWFPFLYYHTSWVADLVVAAHHNTQPSHSDMQQATRIGSFAGFLYALVALVFSLALPPVSKRIKDLTIERLWFLQHLSLGILMLLTATVRDSEAATVITACVGFSWAINQWAPFSILSVEISRQRAVTQASQQSGGSCIDSSEEGMIGKEETEQHDLGAGAVLGLHNVVMGAPQMIAGLQIAILFKVGDVLGIQDKSGWALRLAGLSAFGAMWFSRRLVR